MPFCGTLLTRTVGTLLIQGFGFNDLNTTLLQVPYGTWICLVMLVGAAWHSESRAETSIPRSLASIYASHKVDHLNVRTYLMAGVTLL
jgi:hypothetical protein